MKDNNLIKIIENELNKAEIEDKHFWFHDKWFGYIRYLLDLVAQSETCNTSDKEFCCRLCRRLSVNPDDKRLYLRIDELDLSVRAVNGLQNNGKIEHIGALIFKGKKQVSKIKDIGSKTMSEIENKLNELGLSFDMTIN